MRTLPAFVAALCGALAALLAAGALLLPAQTAPTEPVSAARARVAALLAAAGLPAAAPVDDAAGCPWLGVPGLPPSDQVRPTALVAAPRPPDPGRVLELVAAALRGAGAQVDIRAPAGLVARDAGGYELRIDLGDALRVRAQGPCVWPAGEREPG